MKEIFYGLVSYRKRITKASYCNEDGYERAEGEGSSLEGKNYAIPPGISHYSCQLSGLSRQQTLWAS